MGEENEFNNQGPGKMNYLVDYTAKPSMPHAVNDVG